ncbi:E set domain-containing [Micractinium conductrix]|uniref:E set domain-containing n=1 Tax=Micractinium conductrix TaxID=554055 RepID=A0A2P6V253_9CHLO|nr:E set domain-containing [Micractinium conductrix]|eukprot:PSC68160.1 E set domain-containing [Micractinium conductrix]
MSGASGGFLRQRAATGSVAGGLEDGTPTDRDRSRSVVGMADMARFFKDLGAAPDRGKSIYQHERQRQHLASLVEAGRHAGRSRVEYEGRNIKYHLFTKDFFITVINQKTTTILLVTAFVYLFVFLFFSIWWYLIVRFYPGCLYGATTYVEAFTFSIVTQMTIGYGNTGPQACWAAAWVLAVQIITALLLESIVIGIVFARISHPKQRSRSIFISDSSIIARRDGILKFMFRVADIRRTQVVDPKIKAFMYTWGEGRVTAEGERIPVRCEPLDIGYIDGMLLLPLIIEHTIDERSPLCGHTHDSLMALNAEIVVTFEGTTEFGNPFMARRSYLPTEIHWGHQFAQIVLRPQAGLDDTHYIIDLNKFHDVVPQDGLPLLAPSQLSQLVVNRAKRTVPYPLLGENTLVLSDVLCVAPNEEGTPCLMCRAADTYPNQMLEITVRMYLYRWTQSTDGPTFSQHTLDCGYDTGEDRLYLRLPVEVCHPITEGSPISNWLQPGGLMEDADSEIVVVINSYLHVNGQNCLRQRTYTVHNHVRYGCRFQPIVKHPADSRDRKPRVRWAHFHDINPLSEEELEALPARDAHGLQTVPSSTHLPASIYDRLPSIAPESHGALRSQESRWLSGRTQSSNLASEVEAAEAARRRSTAAGGGGGAPSRPLSGRLGVPAAAAAAAAVPAAAPPPALAPRPSYMPSAEEQRNDYTVLPIDLSRYAAIAGNEGDSIPLGAPGRRSPLPTEFSQALAAARKHQEDVEEGKAEPFLLFPEVANYALNTTDAGDSLPHPQALHPTLPGPDRFRVDYNERSDYTVLPMDLSRYVSQLSRNETMRSPNGGPVTLGEASVLLAQLQQAQAAARAGRSPAAESAARQSTVGESGYATPASAGPSPTANLLAPGAGGSPAATPKLGTGPSAGAAAAAAALGAAAAAHRPRLPEHERQRPAAAEAAAAVQQQQQQQQEEEEAQQGKAGPPSEDGSSTIGDVSEQDEEELSPSQHTSSQAPPAGEGESDGHNLGSAELAQLQQRLSRATSSWAIVEQPHESDDEEEGAGPIHFSKQESWQRERALKNVFASPDSPHGDGGDAAGSASGSRQLTPSSSSKRVDGSPAGDDPPPGEDV